MSRARCDRRHCRAPLEFTTTALGLVVATCKPCQRNVRGLCRDCPTAVASHRHQRCAACAHAHRLVLGRRRDRARYPDRREAMVAGARRRRHASPTIRARIREYQATRRAREGRTWADRAYGRAYLAAWRRRPENRTKVWSSNKRRQIRAEIRRLATLLTRAAA